MDVPKAPQIHHSWEVVNTTKPRSLSTVPMAVMGTTVKALGLGSHEADGPGVIETPGFPFRCALMQEFPGIPPGSPYYTPFSRRRRKS